MVAIENHDYQYCPVNKGLKIAGIPTISNVCLCLHSGQKDRMELNKDFEKSLEKC